MGVCGYLSLMVAAWLALAAVCAGLGLPVYRLIGRRGLTADELLLAPWLGWCVLIALLQLWHLFLPVDGRTLLAVAILGAAGLAFSARELAAPARRLAQACPYAAPVVLLAAFWLANQTAIQHTIYDSGFYHLSAIRWIETYRVVPGLGNLSKMLGFSNSYFLYVALLDTGPFRYKVHHVAGAFLLCLLLVR